VPCTVAEIPPRANVMRFAGAGVGCCRGGVIFCVVAVGAGGCADAVVDSGGCDGETGGAGVVDVGSDVKTGNTTLVGTPTVINPTAAKKSTAYTASTAKMSTPRPMICELVRAWKSAKIPLR